MVFDLLHVVLMFYPLDIEIGPWMNLTPYFKCYFDFHRHDKYRKSWSEIGQLKDFFINKTRIGQTMIH